MKIDTVAKLTEEQEDLNDKSNRDKVLLMEKLGGIRTADEFGTAAILRNKFPHHYPEVAEQRIDKLNLVVQEADFVIDTFRGIIALLERKGYFTNDVIKANSPIPTSEECRRCIRV